MSAPLAMSSPILVVDNYDSFTFNLTQLLAKVARQRGRSDDVVEVVRNDAIGVEALMARAPAAVVLSPGPGLPAHAGICLELVRAAPADLPILGVCLGMQIVAEAYGASLVRAPRLMHGRTSLVRHDGRGVFARVPKPTRVMRYHSWVVDEASLPASLEPSAWADDGTLMALRHRSRPIHAVQFHPESFASEHGAEMVDAFLELSVRRPGASEPSNRAHVDAKRSDPSQELSPTAWLAPRS